MKQSITKTQLDQLSEKGEKKYFDWLVKKGYLNQINHSAMGEVYMGDHFMNIGQMIQFILENDGWSEIKIIHYTGKKGNVCLVVRPQREKEYGSKNLRDSLWKVTKKILTAESQPSTGSGRP